MLISAFTFGEVNSPEPPPIRTMYTASSQYGVSVTTVLRPSRPTAETSSPAVASTREP